MKFWISRSAWILGTGSFFVFFFCGLDYSDPFGMEPLLIAGGKALLGAILVWVAGFIIADIIFKGIVEDIDVHEIEAIENGLAQRVFEKRHALKVVIEDTSVSTHDAVTRKAKLTSSGKTAAA